MSEGGHKIRNPEQSPDGVLSEEHQHGHNVDHEQGRHVGVDIGRGPRTRLHCRIYDSSRTGARTCSPRSRDDPPLHFSCGFATKCSPRSRRCSPRLPGCQPGVVMFPALAGMIRIGSRGGRPFFCVPRARGGRKSNRPASYIMAACPSPGGGIAVGASLAGRARPLPTIWRHARLADPDINDSQPPHSPHPAMAGPGRDQSRHNAKKG